MIRERLFIGLFSGASADGVDAALAAVTGRGNKLKTSLLRHVHMPYEPGLRTRIVDVSSEKMLPVPGLIELHRDIALVMSEVTFQLVKASGVKIDSITAVGSSGQLIGRIAGEESNSVVGSVLELGSPALLSARIRRPVVGQFAQSDAAAGGQGGPITAWVDWLLFHHRRLSRTLVNLGGIVRLTFLGSGSEPVDVVAFDVGPGTILLDELASDLFGLPMDTDGTLAGRGKPSPALLHELLGHPYFQRAAPKTTDRQAWGAMYVSRLKMMAMRHRCSDYDILATASELVARSVSDAVGTLTERPHEIILSGGGATNIYLALRIRRLLSPSSTVTTEKFGIGVRAKQAVCMAVLAAARMDRVAIYCPFATGMKQPAILGALYE